MQGKTHPMLRNNTRSHFRFICPGMIKLGLLLLLVPIIATCGSDDDTDPATSQSETGTTPTDQIMFNGLLKNASGETVSEYGILMVNSDGTDLQRINPDGMLDYSPDWSPNGRRIAFFRILTPLDESETPRTVIVTTDADGANEQTLTDEAEVALNPVWSPDGQRIAFQRIADPTEPMDEWNIVISVMDADGSNLHDVGSVGPGLLVGVTVPSWSPDDNELVFGGVARTLGAPLAEAETLITVMDTDGTNARELLGPEVLGNDAILSTDWSPDGSTIAFVRYRSSALGEGRITEATETIESIWLVDTDGSNPRSITADQLLAAFFPAWSPDGSQIAFVGWEGPADTGIYVIDADGSNLRRLAEGLSGGVEGAPVMAPAWSPDGNWITYLAISLEQEDSEGPLVNAELRLVASDGSEKRTVASDLYVEPVPDPFDSVGKAAPIWMSVDE